jgi:protein-S-isoprenylcysteine O-methyltransferase Ste14
MSIFEIFYLLGWVAAEVIRYPHRMRLKREIRERSLGESRVRAPETIFDMIAFFGTQVIPLFCIFTSWLGFADYSLPAWYGWLGAGIFTGCLLLLWRAHTDLGMNWSARIELQREHTLVTRGV